MPTSDCLSLFSILSACTKFRSTNSPIRKKDKLFPVPCVNEGENVLHVRVRIPGRPEGPSERAASDVSQYIDIGKSMNARKKKGGGAREAAWQRKKGRPRRPGCAGKGAPHFLSLEMALKLRESCAPLF